MGGVGWARERKEGWRKENGDDLGKVGKGRKKIGRGGPERGVKAIVGEGDGDCEKLRKWERNETEALKNGLEKEKGSKNRKVVMCQRMEGGVEG